MIRIFCFRWRNLEICVSWTIYGKLPNYIVIHSTAKSMSEALILESVNPQYDQRLFIAFPENTSSEHDVYKYCFECHTTCSELIFFREFNEQSLVMLRFNWCKNEGFWKRFTCIISPLSNVNLIRYELSETWMMNNKSLSLLNVNSIQNLSLSNVLNFYRPKSCFRILISI